MRLLAVLTDDREVRRYLRGIGEATELPTQAPVRALSYWQSRVFRRRELGDEAALKFPVFDGQFLYAARGKVLPPRVTSRAASVLNCAVNVRRFRVAMRLLL
jgi:hypothetical protein